jgi:hypothetical protein
MTAIAPLAAMAWRRGSASYCIGHDHLGGQSLDQLGGLRRIAFLTCGQL